MAQAAGIVWLLFICFFVGLAVAPGRAPGRAIEVLLGLFVPARAAWFISLIVVAALHP